MQTLNTKLADRLKTLRLMQGWSLQELADKSGVSRSSLSRIENGEVSPTAETLGGLSSVYQISISQLLAPLEAGFVPLVRRDEQSRWEDGENGFSRVIVSPPSSGLSAEVVRCALKPYQIITYLCRPFRAGSEHHLVMLEGTLSVTIAEERFELQADDCLRYQLFGPSRFQTGVDPAHYLVVVL